MAKLMLQTWLACGLIPVLLLLFILMARLWPRRLRLMCLSVMAGWGAAVLLVILMRQPAEGARLVLEPFRTVRLAFSSGRFHYGKTVARCVLNILCFVPLGLSLRCLTRRSHLLVLLLCLGASLAL